MLIQVRKALSKIKHEVMLVDVKDSESGLPPEHMKGLEMARVVDYEQFIAQGDENFDVKVIVWMTCYISFLKFSDGLIIYARKCMI